jgi:hypothetical protein
MGGDWCSRPGRQISVGRKMNILNENYFLRSTNFTLLSQINVNSVNVIFLKLIISVTGDHFDFLPRAQIKT